MIHYVPNLSVKGITIHGIETATHTPEQRTQCGQTITINNYKEIATRVKGIAYATCPDCIAEWKRIMETPFDCDQCKSILKHNDIVALRCTDEERLCLACREKINSKNLAQT